MQKKKMKLFSLTYLYLTISGKINTSPSEKPASSLASHTVIFVFHTQQQHKNNFKSIASKSKLKNQQKSNQETNIENDVVFASFPGFGEALGEWMWVGGFDTWRPSEVVFVAEEHVAIVGVNGAGEILLIHLGTSEAVLGVFNGGGSHESNKTTVVITRENGRITENGGCCEYIMK